MCIVQLRQTLAVRAAPGPRSKRTRVHRTESCGGHERESLLLARLDLERGPDLGPVATERVSVAQDLFLGGIRRVGGRACLDLEGELVPGTAIGSLVEMQETVRPADPAHV